MRGLGIVAKMNHSTSSSSKSSGSKLHLPHFTSIDAIQSFNSYRSDTGGFQWLEIIGNDMIVSDDFRYLLCYDPDKTSWRAKKLAATTEVVLCELKYVGDQWILRLPSHSKPFRFLGKDLIIDNDTNRVSYSNSSSSLQESGLVSNVIPPLGIQRIKQQGEHFSEEISIREFTNKSYVVGGDLKEYSKCCKGLYIRHRTLYLEKYKQTLVIYDSAEDNNRDCILIESKGVLQDQIELLILEYPQPLPTRNWSDSEDDDENNGNIQVKFDVNHKFNEFLNDIDKANNSFNSFNQWQVDRSKKIAFFHEAARVLRVRVWNEEFNILKLSESKLIDVYYEVHHQHTLPPNAYIHTFIAPPTKPLPPLIITSCHGAKKHGYLQLKNDNISFNNIGDRLFKVHWQNARNDNVSITSSELTPYNNLDDNDDNQKTNNTRLEIPPLSHLCVLALQRYSHDSSDPRSNVRLEVLHEIGCYMGNHIKLNSTGVVVANQNKSNEIWNQVGDVDMSDGGGDDTDEEEEFDITGVSNSLSNSRKMKYNDRSNVNDDNDDDEIISFIASEEEEEDDVGGDDDDDDGGGDLVDSDEDDEDVIEPINKHNKKKKRLKIK